MVLPPCRSLGDLVGRREGKCGESWCLLALQTRLTVNEITRFSQWHRLLQVPPPHSKKMVSPPATDCRNHWWSATHACMGCVFPAVPRSLSSSFEFLLQTSNCPWEYSCSRFLIFVKTSRSFPCSTILDLLCLVFSWEHSLVHVAQSDWNWKIEVLLSWEITW